MNNYYLLLFIEAVLVGVLVMIVGSLVGFLVSATQIYPKVKLPEICSTYNSYFIMEFTLFLTGFFSHLFFEFVGANAYYISHGAVLKTLKK
jgi:hypothetical protein